MPRFDPDNLPETAPTPVSSSTSTHTVAAVYEALERDPVMVDRLSSVYWKVFSDVGLDSGDRKAFVQPRRARGDVNAVSDWLMAKFGVPSKPVPPDAHLHYLLPLDGWVVFFASVMYGSGKARVADYEGDVAKRPWRQVTAGRALTSVPPEQGTKPPTSAPTAPSSVVYEGVPVSTPLTPTSPKTSETAAVTALRQEVVRQAEQRARDAAGPGIGFGFGGGRTSQTSDSASPEFNLSWEHNKRYYTGNVVEEPAGQTKVTILPTRGDEILAEQAAEEDVVAEEAEAEARGKGLPEDEVTEAVDDAVRKLRRERDLAFRRVQVEAVERERQRRLEQANKGWERRIAEHKSREKAEAAERKKEKSVESRTKPTRTPKTDETVPAVTQVVALETTVSPEATIRAKQSTFKMPKPTPATSTPRAEPLKLG